MVSVTEKNTKKTLISKFIADVIDFFLKLFLIFFLDGLSVF